MPEHFASDEVDGVSLNHGEYQESAVVQAAERPTKQYQILLLLSGFFVTCHVNGIDSVYGIFREFYTLEETNVVDARGQDTLVALVGTIGSGLTWSGSIFVNPLMARIDNVRMAVLYGVGSSMYYFPIISIALVYFDRHRGFAVGVIVAGSGVGGLIWYTLRAPGARNMEFCGGHTCTMGHQTSPWPWDSWVYTIGPTFSNKRHVYLLGIVGVEELQSLAAFLQAAGNIIPVYYLSSYCVAVLNYPRSMGSLLLAITAVLTVMLSSLSVLAVWYNAPRAQFVAFTVLYGIYAGGYNALLPTTITEIYGVQDYASVNGFIYFIRGLGSIGGAPIAGVILGSHKRGANAADLASQFNGDSLRKRYNYFLIGGRWALSDICAMASCSCS
ncbi:hypothetical protein BDN71DRAFT_1493794 [Pleurotus eryngii]|uniref:Uncharacterized protein n=1 Tax=Pleurotus eryngii TaxID=5323 RepID=A0A9P6DJ50_PLEER|nr:hypothetical protein BDN71DRAFT_1493794 [Pleurotus eryngii]